VERWTVQMPGGGLASTSAYTNCWENPPFRNSAPATNFSACTGSANLLSSAKNAAPAVLVFSEEPRSPYPICLVRKHVENDSKNQTQKNMQLVLHFCTPHCLFLLTGSAVVRTDASQDTRYAPCTERVTVCHAPQAGVTSEANKK